MKKAPTVRDIARIAGVGASTVSLALRNDYRLRPEMRRRVQVVAKALGYRRNATVATLMAQMRTGRTARFRPTLGFVIFSRKPKHLRADTTFREWLRGAKATALKLGYKIKVFWMPGRDILQGHLKQLLSADGIRGLILLAMDEKGVLPKGYEEIWSAFSCVAIGMRPRGASMNFVARDHLATSRHAVEQLLELGCQRVALVIDARIDERFYYEPSAGFFTAVPAEVELIPVFDFRSTRTKAFQRWFVTYKPDGVVTLHKEIKDWLIKKNEIQSVQLAHLNKYTQMGDWHGMQQNDYDIGVAAVEAVIDQLHRNESGIPRIPKAILIQSRWIRAFL